MSTEVDLLGGKVVIVTGAGQGLGRATALGFGRRGAKVALVDNNEATLDGVIKEMPNHGVDSIPILADIAAAGAARAIVEKTTDFFGRLDVLVNNAAVSSVDPFLEVLRLRATQRGVTR